MVALLSLAKIFRNSVAPVVDPRSFTILGRRVILDRDLAAGYGVAMLSGVLRSPRAVAVKIEIVRALVRMRELVLSVKELAAKRAALEQKNDGQFGVVFEALEELMTPPTADESGVLGFNGRPTKNPTP